MWKKTFDYLRTHWLPIVACVLAIVSIGFSFGGGAVQRRLLERDFAVIRTDIAAIKKSEQQLVDNYGKSIVYMDGIDKRLKQYAADYDKLRGLVAGIDKRLSAGTGDIGTIKTNLGQDAVDYGYLTERLKELAKRYGLDLEPKKP